VHFSRIAVDFAFLKPGISIDSNPAIIAITTSSSTNVKASPTLPADVLLYIGFFKRLIVPNPNNEYRYRRQAKKSLTIPAKILHNKNF
jgi:hypothetical protein